MDPTLGNSSKGGRPTDCNTKMVRSSSTNVERSPLFKFATNELVRWNLIEAKVKTSNWNIDERSTTQKARECTFRRPPKGNDVKVLCILVVVTEPSTKHKALRPAFDESLVPRLEPVTNKLCSRVSFYNITSPLPTRRSTK